LNKENSNTLNDINRTRSQPIFDLPNLGQGISGNQSQDSISGRRFIKRRLKNAGLPPETFTPHSFRAATATSLRKKDVPRDRVQYLLGHADARTTALYDHSEDEDVHEIVDQITH